MNASKIVNTGETVRLDAWARVFEKTNRIISGRPITVKVVPAAEVPHGMEVTPGWSDGETVHFNGPLVKAMLANRDPLECVLRLKGLNYHELSHVLYTPRMSDELPRRVLDRAKQDGDPTWWYALNALEDQRIETWFAASYGVARRYFEAAVLQWLVNDGNAEAAILMHGRKYLPARLRVQAGRVFVAKHGQSLYSEFQQVIDDYIQIMLPRDTIRAMGLVVKYRDLLKRMAGNPPRLPVPDNGCHDQHSVPHGKSEGVARVGRVLKRIAEEAREAAQEAMEEAAQADADAAKQLDAEKQAKADADKADAEDQDEAGTASGQSGGEEQGSGDMMPGQGTNPGESQGEGQGQGSGQDGTDGDGDGDGGSTDGVGGESAGAGGAGAGTGAVEHKVLGSQAELQNAIDEMVQEAYDALDDVRNDADVQSDVDNVLEAVKAVANNGKIDANGPLARGRTTIDAEDRDNLAYRKVYRILQTIRQEAEPQTLRRQVNGRVDARRALTRRPNEVDIFTLYDEGAEDDTGMEAVVLLDVSGSMSHIIRDASAAVWALKRAFDRLEVRTTVLLYDTAHQVMWQPGDKASARIPVINAGGGTDPTSALEQANLILAKSHQPNKVLITVTDGGWGGNEAYFARLMRTMHSRGVTSMILGLGSSVQYYGKHSHMEGHDITTIADLPKAALALVSRIMRGATERV